MKASWWLRNQFLGEGEILPEPDARRDPTRYNTAYFCPMCGEIWARVAVEGQKQWISWSVQCDKHHSPYWPIIYGSMYLMWDRSFNDSMPEPALWREFDLALAHFDRMKERYPESETT